MVRINKVMNDLYAISIAVCFVIIAIYWIEQLSPNLYANIIDYVNGIINPGSNIFRGGGLGDPSDFVNF